MLNDNEIFKALECCVVDAVGTRCWACPFAEINDCGSALFKDTVSLINRQQAEIEQLKEVSEKLLMNWNGLSGVIKRAKAEAIKEFAERFLKTAHRIEADDVNETLLIRRDFFERLVKEMKRNGG